MTTERLEATRDLTERLSKVSTRKRAQWRLGRRGAFLVSMGLLYIVLAWSYGGHPLPTFSLQQLSMQTYVMELLGVTSSHAAMQIWGVLWAIAGLIAIVTAWWPVGKDQWGFNALMGFSTAWSVMSFIGELVFGAERAFVVGLIFLVYTVSILIAAGMVDPGPMTKVVTETEEAEDAA